MLRKPLICVILLFLLLGVSTVSAEDPPPRYKYYLPIVSAHYRPGMVYIPAGAFQMGCHPDHNAGWPCNSGSDLHSVTMEAYYIDKYEVTNAQYDECEAQGGCDPYHNGNHDNPVYANHPFEGDILLAMKYCTWAGKHLPSEEEWEKAARGTDLRTYPWGDEPPTCELTNYGVNPNTTACVGATVEVGSYPLGASPYGALDMAGNAYEWTNSWGADYPTGSIELMGPDMMVVRGGNYYSPSLHVTTSYRLRYPVGGSMGFRCAASEP